MTTEHRQEIDRLIQVEYGEAPELALRLFGVPFGTLILFLYTGWTFAWFWPLSFFLAHGLYYGFLKTRGEDCSLGDVQVASGLFLVVMSSFLWMPAFMAAQSDINLVFAGSTLLATALVFLVRRGDTIRFLVWGEVAVICAMYVAVYWYRPPAENMLAKWSGFATNLILVGYLAQALVMSRKAKLAELEAVERAVQEQKMAAIGELAGGVAHDFNNTLTAILGNLELCRELPDQVERDAALDAAFDAAKRAEAVVKQLLIYSRKAPSFRTDLDLIQTVPRMMELAQRLIPDNIVVKMEMSETPLGVRVDETQLMTALINLVVNAVEAMPDGGVVTVRTDQRRAGSDLAMVDGAGVAVGSYGVVDVCDTGEGIAGREISKVVQPFYSAKTRGKGTGLGLPMVLGFTRIHAGGLRVLSPATSDGRGTRVEIWLPSLGVDIQTPDAKMPPQGAAFETA
ncbi:ATP-binding protein [uncultured Pelagimonas sp.]|uniref:ATP-binding protein n=1 Tax=uncultured Pelagimonas sp. TaxID=1618102 RepID=UPI0026064404|nr:ATP-binding protein [uncultured Pelagimonas sp.]